MPFRQDPDAFFNQNYQNLMSLAKKEIQRVQEEPAPQLPAAPYHPTQRSGWLSEDNSWKILLVVALALLGIATLAFLAYLKSTERK